MAGLHSLVTAQGAATKQPRALGFVGELHRVPGETAVKVIAIGTQRCSSLPATALGMRAADEALHVVRIRLRGRVRVMLLDAWIPPSFAKAVTQKALRMTPLCQRIAGSADPLGRRAQQVSAALADPPVADAMQVDINSAVLKIGRLIHHRSDASRQFRSVRSSPERSRQVTELSGSDTHDLDAGRLVRDVAG